MKLNKKSYNLIYFTLIETIIHFVYKIVAEDGIMSHLEHVNDGSGTFAKPGRVLLVELQNEFRDGRFRLPGVLIGGTIEPFHQVLSISLIN